MIPPELKPLISDWLHRNGILPRYVDTLFFVTPHTFYIRYVGFSAPTTIMTTKEPCPEVELLEEIE
jgi:hypothetical protein